MTFSYFLEGVFYTMTYVQRLLNLMRIVIENQVKIFLIDLFKQIGFDLVSHNFKFSGETYILPTTFKFDITKDEMLELLAVLKLKGY